MGYFFFVGIYSSPDQSSLSLSKNSSSEGFSSGMVISLSENSIVLDIQVSAVYVTSSVFCNLVTSLPP